MELLMCFGGEAPAGYLNLNLMPKTVRQRIEFDEKKAEWRRAAWAWGLRDKRVLKHLSFPLPAGYIEFNMTGPGPIPDPHNLTPTTKAMVDGLVDAGIFTNDTPDIVTVGAKYWSRSSKRTVMISIYRRETWPTKN